MLLLMKVISILCTIIHIDATYLKPIKCITISRNFIDCSGGGLVTTTFPVNSREAMYIKTINYSNNYIHEVKGLDYFPNIEKIDLRLNSLKKIKSIAFSSLKNLTDLDLSFNYIHNINTYVFIKNKQLKKLSLQENFLILPEEMPIFCSISLETLNLRGNRISSITEENLVCLPSLKELNLRLNFLTMLTPKVFSLLKNLMSIDIHFNSLYCTCNLVDLLKWANFMKIDLSNSESITCILSNNGTAIMDIEKVEKDLNCIFEENSEISISQDIDVIPVCVENNNGVRSFTEQKFTETMKLISHKLHLIEVLYSLVVFTLITITFTLLYRRYLLVTEMGNSLIEYI